MTNHFYTLLANVSYNSNTPYDHVSKDFNALILDDVFQSFYKLIFPTGTSRAQILKLSRQITALIDSTMLRDKLVQYDSRITYSFDDNGDSFTFTIPGTINTLQRWDALELFSKFENNPNVVNTLLAKKSVNNVNYVKQENNIYNLASLIICYVDRLNSSIL